MAQEKWYKPVDIGQHIYTNEIKQEETDHFEENFEMDIDSRYKLLHGIKEKFNTERDNWLDVNKDKYIENFRDKPNFRISHDYPLELIVKEFSKDYVRIFVIFKFGYSRWHHYYVLLKDYLVKRNE